MACGQFLGERSNNTGSVTPEDKKLQGPEVGQLKVEQCWKCCTAQLHTRSSSARHC